MVPFGGELALEVWRNSAKSGFDSISSFLTCLAMTTRLSPQLGQGSTSCLGSPISIKLFLRALIAFLFKMERN